MPPGRTECEVCDAVLDELAGDELSDEATELGMARDTPELEIFREPSGSGRCGQAGSGQLRLGLPVRTGSGTRTESLRVRLAVGPDSEVSPCG